MLRTEFVDQCILRVQERWSTVARKSEIVKEFGFDDAELFFQWVHDQVSPVVTQKRASYLVKIMTDGIEDNMENAIDGADAMVDADLILQGMLLGQEIERALARGEGPIEI